MSIFTKADAILAINPDSKFSYFHPPRDEIKWLSNNISQPTEENIQIEISRLQAEYNAQEYARNRASAYDSIGNQLDLLFHDMTAGKGSKTGEWYKAVAKVKADNPKG